MVQNAAKPLNDLPHGDSTKSADMPDASVFMSLINPHVISRCA
jgi:hypothetical protein